jgi:hypothetical protein
LAAAQPPAMQRSLLMALDALLGAVVEAFDK